MRGNDSKLEFEQKDESKPITRTPLFPVWWLRHPLVPFRHHLSRVFLFYLSSRVFFPHFEFSCFKPSISSTSSSLFWDFKICRWDYRANKKQSPNRYGPLVMGTLLLVKRSMTPYYRNSWIQALILGML